MLGQIETTWFETNDAIDIFVYYYEGHDVMHTNSHHPYTQSMFAQSQIVYEELHWLSIGKEKHLTLGYVHHKMDGAHR